MHQPHQLPQKSSTTYLPRRELSASGLQAVHPETQGQVLLVIQLLGHHLLHGLQPLAIGAASFLYGRVGGVQLAALHLPVPQAARHLDALARQQGEDDALAGFLSRGDKHLVGRGVGLSRVCVLVPAGRDGVHPRVPMGNIRGEIGTYKQGVGLQFPQLEVYRGLLAGLREGHQRGGESQHQERFRFHDLFISVKG